VAIFHYPRKERRSKVAAKEQIDVEEVAARLGVSSHSLYKWMEAVRPSKDEQRGDERMKANRAAACSVCFGEMDSRELQLQRPRSRMS
jgi:transposase-like protein